MGSTPARLPVVSIMLLLLTVGIALRSIWREDTFCWRSLASDQSFVSVTEWGLQTTQLGLRLYYDQRLIEAPTVRKRNAALDQFPAVGPEFSSKVLVPKPTFVRWLGLDLQRTLNERPESFANTLAVVGPLWLLSIALAVRPMRWLLARRRLSKADPTNNSSERNRGDTMRIVIGVVCGLAVGMAVMFLFLRRPDAPDHAVPVAATEPAPKHPIVGSWRIEIDGMVLTYTFNNNDKFLLTFRGIPGPRGPVEAQTQGFWKIDGNDLILKNTATNSNLSVVGEEERATLDSISADKLLLTHLDRKGRPEQLEFMHVAPFLKGRFDNPVLLGKWKSERTVLELKVSGDAMLGNVDSRPNRGTIDRTAIWSQQGTQLRMMVDAPPPSRRGYGGQPPPAPPPAEIIYEIVNVSADRNMLLLQRVNGPNAPAPVVTFYRMN